MALIADLGQDISSVLPGGKPNSNGTFKPPQQSWKTPKATTNGLYTTRLPSAKTSETAETPLRNATAWTPRKKLKIITIGAGFSGFIFAHKLQHEHPECQDLVVNTIYEARDDIGGTWLVNRYPGVQCDVPAHVYAFPFDPKPDWSHFFATGAEIHQYIKDTVKKWNLGRDLKLKHNVVETTWNEERGQWRVVIDNEGRVFEQYADLLVSAQGVLNSWRWPNIPGLHTFQGHKCHSAEWDSNFDYSGKRIAVIGNGSSGVQIIPALARLPNTQIVTFQRTPNYVYTHLAPGSLLGNDNDLRQNPPYTTEEREKFVNNPDFHRDYRRKIIHNINSSFKIFVKDSDTNKAFTTSARKQMADKLKADAALCDKLIPKWEFGCRRITPGEGYLESLMQENVQAIASGVVKVTEDSVQCADGQTFQVDVIVCATGYEGSLLPRWRIVGRNGVDLRKEWTERPQSYLSLAARDMPNYFIFLGPNAVTGHGSLLEAVNWAAEYMVKWIRKMATENIKSIVPKSRVIDELVRYEDEIHKTLVWSASCTSWFKRNTADGVNIANFAGSAITFRKLVNEIRAEDFEIEYFNENRWTFLGNGFTDFELDPSNSLSWYIEH